MATEHSAPSATLVDTPANTPDAPVESADTPSGPESERKTKPLRDRIVARQARRKTVRARRDAQVKAIYPFARTFRLKTADAVGPEAHAKDASERLPRTITLITPDHDDPEKDHLYVGAHPVLSRNHHYDSKFEELTFVTSDGTSPVRGHLRLTRSRTRAFGILEYAGHSFAVEYAVEPQRYRMKVGKGAAYLAGVSLAPAIKWDETSDRWKNAPWTEDYVAGFRYGVTGEEVIGDETVYDFVASFDDITTGKKWEPFAGDYLGLLDNEGVLKFALQAGASPPQSGHEGGNLFPYMLRVKLSEFGFDFVGGMLTEKPDLQGTVYGLQGDWDGGHVAGLYHLHNGESGPHVVVSVHGRRLHVGHTPVETSELEGNTLRWHGLSDGSGLPESGHLTFSEDGQRIVDSSLGVTGERIHPDQAAEVAHALAGPTELADGLRHSRALTGDSGHTLSDLIRMSQYVQDGQGFYYDLFQQQSMEDFYAILQNHMDTKYREQFFNPNPPPLAPGLYGISQTPGKKGTAPDQWYKELSVAYTSATLSKWSTDPGAKLLNGRRADAWLQNQTAISDVMQAQGPLLYARRYGMKWENLDWFLQDQQNNYRNYEQAIDDKVAEWVAEVKANVTGDQVQLQKVIDQINELGKTAKEKKLYWAFAVYSYTARSAYLNMLQTVMMSGDEIDGSEFTQRVQRTVALLNVLDTSSYFSGQYAYMLQLFQLANLLPQMIDYSDDLEDFSFATKQIIDKFIKDYIDSPDPNMREAAEELQKHASQDTVDRVLQVLRQSSAVAGGLYNWTNLAAEFESRAARVLSHLPALVTKMIMMGAVGLMINYFITGTVRWSDLTTEQKVIVIGNGAGIVAQIGLFLLKRGIAFSEVFVSGNGLWSNFKLFFSRGLIQRAQNVGASGFKGWLLETGGIADELDALSMRSLFAETAAEAAALEARASRIMTMQKIFGRNLSEFLATRLGAALAAVGIVVSAIMLAQGGESIEVAANALFLAASTLEFIATAGLWACQAFAIASIGGVAIGTLFAVISVVGFIAMIAGAVLIAILLFRPQKSPVEKFAEEDAGTYYMPFKAEIDYFQEYQSGSEPQRSGVSVTPNGESSRALYIGSDGSLQQKAFDATGHTAFYLRVDEFGRAQFGAPIVDSDGRRTLMVLALDADGNLVAKNATENTLTNGQMQWRAEIQGGGNYDGDYLRSASFKLYNEYWNAQKGAKRYISTDAQSGWKATDGDGSSLQVEMVTTKPQELRMADIAWYTYQHDQRQSPALSVAGSAPRSWTLAPDPPTGLAFFSETGTVAMEIGTDVPPVEAKTYTLSVTNAAGSTDTKFSLAVKPA